MRKLTKITRREKDQDPELDISSLIDVSFLLLIFFLVTSSLIKREGELGLNLPGEGTGDPDVALDITIAGDGRIDVGGQELAGPSDGTKAGRIEEVRQHLKTHKELTGLYGDTAMVSLSASDEACTQRFVDVLNALDSAGIENIAIRDYVAAN